MSHMDWINAPHDQNALASSRGIMSHMRRMLALNHTANCPERFTDSGALSPEENRALAKSLLARMDEAGDIRLALNRGGHDATVKEWRSIADGVVV